VPNTFHSISEWLRHVLKVPKWPFSQPKAEENTEPPLTGAPVRLRIKTYSGATGLVYQYLYKGQQTANGSTFFVFHVTDDRKSWNTIRVLIDNTVVAELEESESLTLTATERYAVAKLTLFEFFDQAETLSISVPLRPDVNGVKEKLVALGLL
jgi:hypothetical protein